MTREELAGAGSPQSGGMSRRKLIIGGASLAAAGVAVGAVIPIGSADDQTAAPQSQPSGDETGPPTGPEQVVVHVRDAQSGRLDLFVGTRHFSFTDRAVSDQLVKAAASAT